MRRFLVASAIATVCGCGSGSSGPTGPTTRSEAGVYTLVSLNGQALPTSVAEGGRQIEVVSGTLTLGSDHTVRVSTSYRLSPGAAPATNEVSGTYSIQGDALTFSYSNGGRNSGTLDGDTLRVTNEGVVWTYRRT